MVGHRDEVEFGRPGTARIHDLGEKGGTAALPLYEARNRRGATPGGENQIRPGRDQALARRPAETRQARAQYGIGQAGAARPFKRDGPMIQFESIGHAQALGRGSGTLIDQDPNAG